MNKLGVHALVWAGDLTPESTRKVLSQTKAAGFDLAELSLARPESHGPGAHARFAAGVRA